MAHQTLTENVVLVRTRSHDLNSVKKLNCWGCTLKDVSIVNRMPNVEVISLSINSIDTLQYFAACTMLQELYLRKNEIRNINEILHLSQLQFLKKLSLEDNPCTQVENYRLTVLKALPNLEILDNQKVTAEELYQAEKLGKELAWPGTELDNDDEDEEEDGLDLPTASQQQQDTETANPDYNFESTPVHNPHAHSTVNVERPQQDYSHHNQSNGIVNNSQENLSNYSHQQHQHQSQQQTRESNLRHNNSVTRESSSSSTSSKQTRTNMAKANSLSDYNIYSTNGNFRCSSPALSGTGTNPYEQMITPISAATDYYDQNNGPTPSGPIIHGAGYHHSNNAFIPINNQSNGNYRPSKSGSSSSAASSNNLTRLPKGGKNRNANILSAVLCLIKELDYGSLEVVDTTIHCRMEEMEELN